MLNLVAFFMAISIIWGQNIKVLAPLPSENSEPIYEIEKISDSFYQDAFDKNENDPLRTDYYSKVVYPETTCQGLFNPIVLFLQENTVEKM